MKVYSNDGNEVTSYSGSYALLIGVSNYTNGWPSLQSIPSEIKTIKEALEEKGFTVKMVLDPNSKTLKNSYESFIDTYGYDANNRLLFFYSGHGYSSDNGTKGYLVPTDAANPNIDIKDFKIKSLKMDRILSLSREMEAKHALFLFDSCFSGTIFKTKALPNTPPYIESSMSKPVRQFITAGSAGEEVPAKSVFTPLFIDGIKGDADLNKDGYVTGSELGMYLMNKVPNYKEQNPQYGKIKDYDLSRGDFIFLNKNKNKNANIAEESSYSFKSMQPDEYSLTINTVPNNAKIEILNIDEKYHSGIKLKKGSYTVRVSENGYLPKEGVVNINNNLDIDILLDRSVPESARVVYEKAPVYSNNQQQPSATQFKRCAACHGAQGEKSALNRSKIIAQMSKYDIITALRGYKDGSYGGPMQGLMKGQAASLSDTDIKDIAYSIGR